MTFLPIADSKYIGKRIIHYNECASTNTQASELAKKDKLDSGDIVITDFQSQGKGQAGNAWDSKEGENLTFSIFLKNPQVKLEEQFYLTMAISLAVHSFYRELLGHSVSVKWPNDVLYNSQKLAGILIESSIRQNKMEYVIIGLGLNINQQNFAIPNATSPASITGKSFDLESMLSSVSTQLESFLELVALRRFQVLKNNYLNELFGFGERRGYRDSEEFVGTIKDVDSGGRLVVEREGVDHAYNFKEITFLM